MRLVNEIIVHCSATKPEWMDGKGVEKKCSEIRKWHIDRGWNDIGYHMIIDRDGEVAPGRPVEKQGAHVSGHNKNTVGVCLIGGNKAKATDQFSDHFTPEQDKTLRQIIAEWQEAQPGITKISGHNEYANKGCPGFNVTAWLSSKKDNFLTTILRAIFALLRNFLVKEKGL